MKLLFFLLTLIYLSSTYDPSSPSAGTVSIGSSYFCPAYVCQTSSFKTGCVTYSGSQMLMEGCLGDWYCNWESTPSSSTPYQFGKCELRRKGLQFRKNVGEYCYQNEDCKSYHCISNKCSVKTTGSSCDNSYQCGKGLLCDSSSFSTCQSWLADGSDCSSKTYMCAPSSGCISVDGSTPKCTKYFSLATNTISSVNGAILDLSYAYYCTSGSIKSTGQCSSTSFTSQGGYPKTCTDSSQCYATQDSIQTSCSCMPNTEGVKYCMPQAGDVPDMINSIKSKITQDFRNYYNYELSDQGMADPDVDRSWAPQIKKGTWGSCFDSVGLKITDSPSTYNNQCPAIKCTTGNNDEGYCFQYIESSHMFYAQACPNNYLCGSLMNGQYSLGTSHIKCKEVRNKNNAHKGEWCWVDGDCYSGMCGNDKVCSVYSQGSTCTDSSQCDKGLLCAGTYGSQTCQSWLNIGDACTNENYELCRPGSYCLSSSASVTSGTCQAKYSVAGGQTMYRMYSSGSSQYGSDYLCKSGAWDSQNKICFSASHKLSSFPKSCSDSNSGKTDCQSINYKEGSYDYTSCSCFPNTQGQHYCRVYTANIDSDYYNWLSNYYSSDLSNCYSYEIGSNYGTSCSLGSRYIDVWGRSIPGGYFPSCGRDVLYDENRYEDDQKYDLIFQYVFSSRLAVAVSFLLGILLFK